MPGIEVRNEHGDLMGYINMSHAIDARCKRIVIPYWDGRSFSQLVLPVQRVRCDDDHFLALRANSQDLERLRRMENFTPVSS